MKFRKLLAVLMAAIFVLAVVGCAKKTPANNKDIDIEEDDEEFENDFDDTSEEEYYKEHPEVLNPTPEAEPVTEPEIENESETDSGNEEKLIRNNGGYFVEYDGNVYFHAPTDESMNEVAVFGEFCSKPGSEQRLFRSEVETGETALLLEEFSYGEMYLSGGYLLRNIYQIYGSDYYEHVSAYNVDGDDEYDPLDDDDIRIIGTDPQGKYAIGVKNIYGSEGGYPAAVRIIPICGGEAGESIEFANSFDFIGIDENRLFGIETVHADGASRYKLRQINLENGNVIDLGELPGSEFGRRVCDQAVMKDGTLYFLFGEYEGTGNYFYGSMMVTASYDTADSVSAYDVSEGVEDIMWRSPAFYVEDGVIVYCDGVPGTAGIEEGWIGFYNNEGKFVKVASGYSRTAFGDDDVVNEVELAELVGSDIYVVYNVSEHVPDEDIGWRYAYRRKSIEIFKLNIVTGEKTVLFVCER